MRVPLPLKQFTVLPPHDASEVDAVAAGFWTNSRHDVGPAALVHCVPKFVVEHVSPVDVPGAHSETLPLVMATVAYVLAVEPFPFVRRNVTPAASEVTVALLLDTQYPEQLSPPAIQ